MVHVKVDEYTNVVKDFYSRVSGGGNCGCVVVVRVRIATHSCILGGIFNLWTWLCACVRVEMCYCVSMRV